MQRKNTFSTKTDLHTQIVKELKKANPNISSILKTINADPAVLDFSWQDETTKETLLITSIMRNQYEVFSALLKKGANLNQRDINLRHILNIACANPDIRFLNALFDIDKNLDPNASDSDLSTCMHYASRRGYVEHMKQLVEKGANIYGYPPSAPKRSEFSSFHMAIYSNEPKSLDFLIDNIPKEKFDFLDDKGRTLICLIETSELEEKKKYIDKLIPLENNFTDDNLNNQLHRSIKWGSLTIFRYALRDEQLEERVKTKNKSGDTPLHLLTETKYATFLTELLEKNIEIDLGIKNAEGKTVADLLIEHNNPEGFKLIIGLEIKKLVKTENAEIDEDMFFIDIVKSYKKPSFIRSLFNGKDKAGKFMLLQTLSRKLSDAITNNNIEDIKFFLTVFQNLLEKKICEPNDLAITVNIPNAEGDNLLHIFAKHPSSPQDLSLIKMLISLNININAQNKNGDTPLHWVVSSTNKITIFLNLLNHGVTILQNNAGDTPLHIAVTNKQLPIIRKLLDIPEDKKKDLEWLNKRNEILQIRNIAGETAEELANKIDVEISEPSQKMSALFRPVFVEKPQQVPVPIEEKKPEPQEVISTEISQPAVDIQPVIVGSQLSIASSESTVPNSQPKKSKNRTKATKNALQDAIYDEMSGQAAVELSLLKAKSSSSVTPISIFNPNNVTPSLSNPIGTALSSIEISPPQKENKQEIPQQKEPREERLKRQRELLNRNPRDLQKKKKKEIDLIEINLKDWDPYFSLNEYSKELNEFQKFVNKEGIYFEIHGSAALEIISYPDAQLRKNDIDLLVIGSKNAKEGFQQKVENKFGKENMTCKSKKYHNYDIKIHDQVLDITCLTNLEKEENKKHRSYTLLSCTVKVTPQGIFLVGDWSWFMDILNGVINTVGDPMDNLKEDPIRKLHGIRLMEKLIKFDGNIHFNPETLEAICSDEILFSESKEKGVFALIKYLVKIYSDFSKAPYNMKEDEISAMLLKYNMQPYLTLNDEQKTELEKSYKLYNRIGNKSKEETDAMSAVNFIRQFNLKKENTYQMRNNRRM